MANIMKSSRQESATGHILKKGRAEDIKISDFDEDHSHFPT